MKGGITYAQVNRNHDVGSDKVLDRPIRRSVLVMRENSKSVEKDDNDEEDQRRPRCVWLELGLEDHIL